MKLEEIMLACRRRRLWKLPLRFRPTLIYLVEVRGCYVHPSRDHYTSGQTAWADSSLWFQCYRDAADYAARRPASDKAKVIKLNIAAFEEPVIGQNTRKQFPC